jgi:ketosteroid isomerase-like protein
MAAVDDFEEVLEQCQLAIGEFVKGDPKPIQKLFSHQEDVTLANPLGPAAPGIGPVAHGSDEVAKTQEHAASHVRDGESVGFEIVARYVTAELAYVVWIERLKAKVGGGEDITPFTQRATMIFRPEESEWKVVHRHADPITTPQPAESVIQE